MLALQFSTPVASLALVLTACAAQYQPHQAKNIESGGGYVELPLQHRQIKSPMKRQNEMPILHCTEWAYLVNITIGSDKQPISLLFDTGSSLTWVNPDCLKLPDIEGQSKEICSRLPRYDPFTSSTANILDRSFNQTYGLGGMMGTYFTDDITLGSATAEGQHFGVAVISYDADAGVFGAGPEKAGMPQTHIKTLAAQGQINSHAFSIDLRSRNETGSIILGGIDTAKYKCELNYVRGSGYMAIMTDIGITLPNGTSIKYEKSLWNRNNTEGLSVLFDSGTPVNLLPNNLIFAISEHYPEAQMYFDKNKHPAFKVPCEAPNGSFDYSLGNTTIHIPFYDAIFEDAEGICSFGFRSGPSNPKIVPYILGASFMRGAYMVFDRDNDELWLGESADCGSNIIPIGTGKNAVPLIPGCGCEAKHNTRSGHAPPSGPLALAEADYVL